jgi:hypothetical protein
MKFRKVIDTSEKEFEMVIYLETNEENIEVRKIELSNGSLIGYADQEAGFNGTVLIETPLLSNNEINAIPGMSAVKITREEFESIWERVIISTSN